MDTQHTHMGNALNDTRERILSVGHAMMVEKGFSAIGLAALLARAGVPKGSFYHYFASKEQFGEALITRYFAAYQNTMQQLLADDTRTGKARLLDYFHGWQARQSSCQAQEKCLVVKLSAEVADLSQRMRREFEQGCLGVIACIAALIGQGQSDGSLSEALNAEMLAQELYFMWLGASLINKLADDGSPFDAAMDATRRFLG